MEKKPVRTKNRELKGEKQSKPLLLKRGKGTD
jgi:hypothetical protein